MRPAPRTHTVSGLIASALILFAATSSCQAANAQSAMVDPGRSRDLVNRPNCCSCEHLDNSGRCEMGQD